MKLITREEMLSQPLRGHGNSGKVLREVASLQKGQILFIESQDWGTRKYSPGQIVRYIAKKYKRKFSFLRHAALTGWVVERLE